MAEAGTIVRSMIACPLPIVAAVIGPAVGLGCSLASLSDLVVIEEHAYSPTLMWPLAWWRAAAACSPGR